MPGIILSGTAARYSSVIDLTGQIFTFDYDELNRRTDQSLPGTPTPYMTLTKVHTAYDANNNVIRIDESKGTTGRTTITDATTNTYDDFDRLLTSDTRGLTVTYAYDNNGNRTLVSTSTGSTSYEYDTRNRLTIVRGSEGATGYTYYPDGKKDTITYANGTGTRYTYHPTNRIKTLVNNASDGTIISSYAYDHDKNGNRTSQTEVNGVTETTTYTYDTLDRMTSFLTNNSIKTEYTFEGYNRKTEKETTNGIQTKNRIYTYDETDWLLNVQDYADPARMRTIAYAYDRNGNTIQKTDSLVPTENKTFDYDSLNRLVQAKTSTGTSLGLYDYNSQNLRIRHRNSERGDVDYFYDGRSVIEEHASDTSFLARYQYGDRLIAMNALGGSQYYLQDALGSTVNMSDTAGKGIVTYNLDPWGTIKNQTGYSFNTHIFTGKEFDVKTGLVYFGARYYDSNTARFITQDTYLGEYGTPPSLHRYLYAYSNPTVYVDLFGYESVTTMLDQAATSAGQEGNDLKLAGIVAVQSAYKVCDALTFGWIQKHDAARDKYDRGEITQEQYLGKSLEAAAQSGVLLGATVATGGLVGAATKGMSLTSQLLISGGATGLAYQGTEDALTGHLSDPSQYWGAMGMGMLGGGLARGGIAVEGILGKTTVSEGMQVLKSTLKDRAQEMLQITNEVKSGLQEVRQEIFSAYKQSSIGNERGGILPGGVTAPAVEPYQLRKNYRYEDANVVNRAFGGEPPYKSGGLTTDFQTGTKEQFVRMYTRGFNEPEGRWLMSAEDIKGLTPKQIQQKFALPEVPTHIVDAEVPSNFRLRMGEAGPNAFAPTGGGGIQAQALDDIDLIRFYNGRPLR